MKSRAIKIRSGFASEEQNASIFPQNNNRNTAANSMCSIDLQDSLFCRYKSISLDGWFNFLWFWLKSYSTEWLWLKYVYWFFWAWVRALLSSCSRVLYMQRASWICIRPKISYAMCCCALDSRAAQSQILGRQLEASVVAQSSKNLLLGTKALNCEAA